MYDVSVTHPSEIVSEAFRCSHIVFASTTYNAGIFCNMETLLLDLKAQFLLSYNELLLVYILMKLEGVDLKDHPLFASLVRAR